MKKACALIICGLFLWGCSKPKYTVLIREAENAYYKTRDPYAASKALITHVNNENEDQLLFMMEAGMLLHAAEQFDSSNKILLLADKKADNMAKSISGEAASYFTNERGKPYRGEDYERVLVNMILGINFMKQGKYDSAMVEFKKVTYKLNAIKKKTGRKYKMNLMAKYLAAVAATAADELEFAYVELKQIERIKPGIPIIARRLMQTALLLGYNDDYKTYRAKYRRYAPKNAVVRAASEHSDLVMIYQAGKAPIKVSRGRLLDEKGMRVTLHAAIRVAILSQNATGVTIATAMALLATAQHPIPKYKRRRSSVNRALLKVTDEAGKEYKVSSALLNNVEDTMVKNFEDQYASMRSKMVKRIAIKVVATIVAQQVAERTAKKLKAGGGVAALIGFAAGAAVGVATFSAEKPDLRCWHTLPASFQAGQLILKPGKYNATLSYYQGSSVVEEKDLGEITVKEKQPTIVLARSTD